MLTLSQHARSATCPDFHFAGETSLPPGVASGWLFVERVALETVEIQDRIHDFCASTSVWTPGALFSRELI